MAQKKDLIVVAGGAEEDFKAAEPMFAGFARAAYHMGPPRIGRNGQASHQLVLFGNRLALAEGLVLGTKAGMQTDNLLKVLQDGACSSKTIVR